MKSIILSCTPAECEKIVNGDMSILVRKVVPKEVPFKAYIYCTKTKNKWSLCDYEGAYQNSEGEIVYAQQHVIGEFICDRIDRIKKRGINNNFDYCYLSLNEWGNDDIEIEIKDIQKSCISKSELNAYGENSSCLYGLHISDLKIYDKPKPIMQFYKPCPIKIKNCPVCELYSTYTGCCMNNIDRPPKNYIYVEE